MKIKFLFHSTVLLFVERVLTIWSNDVTMNEKFLIFLIVIIIHYFSRMRENFRHDFSFGEKNLYKL